FFEPHGRPISKLELRKMTTAAPMLPPAFSWMTETSSHQLMRIGPNHKCCSASQPDTAPISASVFSANRYPPLLGGRWFGTSTYLTLGTRDPSARAALSSM